MYQISFAEELNFDMVWSSKTRIRNEVQNENRSGKAFPVPRMH